MDATKVINNWIVCNIAILGTIQATGEKVFEPFSLAKNHPPAGETNTGLVPTPLVQGSRVGLMGRGMWTLGAPMLQAMPIIDYWVCHDLGNAYHIVGQYRHTQIECVGRLTPLAPFPTLRDTKPGLIVDATYIGNIQLGLKMEWHGTKIVLP